MSKGAMQVVPFAHRKAVAEKPGGEQMGLLDIFRKLERDKEIL